MTRTLTLILIHLLFLTACGEGEAPATSATSESGTDTADTQQQAATAEPQPAPQVAEPAPPAPVVAEPAPPAPAEQQPAVTTPVPEAAPAPQTTTSATPVDGGKIYNTYCAICHKAGMNAAPKHGSKPLWAKRIAQGRETMYSHAINGLRGMPPRGGFAQLTDEEVKAGVDYMVRAAGGWQD